MPHGPNAQGYSPIRYGQKNQKVGYAKVGQARNQNPKPDDPNGPQSPGAGGTGTTYLSPEQQAKVAKLLGDTYDPTKPLNVQLFKARWANATPEERRTIAKNVSGQFLEGGPTSTSLAGFHGEYLDVLREENQMLQRTFDENLSNYSQAGGGYATTQDEMNTNMAYWTNFASTPEGQAHIAQTGMTPEAWIANQTEQLQAGVDNYAAQQKQFSQIQNLAARLGTDVPGFKPPGWESSLASIQAGTAPIPNALMHSMYPGIASDIAGVSPDLYQRQSRKVQESGAAAVAGGTGGLYQPFTQFTGVQQPNSFSERDLYQETQSR
jgi:hypothetical protein